MGSFHYHQNANSGYHPARALATAADEILGKDEKFSIDSDKYSLYKSIIDRLAPREKREISEFEISALWVAIISIADAKCRNPNLNLADQSEKPWECLTCIAKIGRDERKPDAEASNEIGLYDCESNGDQRCGAAQSEWIRYVTGSLLATCDRINRNWHRALTSREFGENFLLPKYNHDGSNVANDPVQALSHFRLQIVNRVSKARDLLEKTLNKQREHTDRAEKVRKATTNFIHYATDQLLVPPLSAFVQLPKAAADQEKTLRRYLWGSDLLGSEHLQYPENLLLAAHDIVDQFASENVIYSELRCATTGYTLGGMTETDATDFLCLAFDAASLHHGLLGSGCTQAVKTNAAHAGSNRRWVRINLLLSAKRGRNDEEFSRVVNLLSYYLQKEDRGNPGLPYMPTAPEWWRPCAVAGFDLSGDEAKRETQHRELLRPLYKFCPNITIHAGEAQTADSMWEAIYNLRARRIGHGLKLQENRRLLEYCVTEGIAMELCPTSNEYTNAFAAPSGREAEHRLEAYPLRYYMSRGLDVCINTDNRHLHEKSTVTDEYLCAARLSGGLTKWEVLKLVKAGFKHAFLSKHEVALLLRDVEYEIYMQFQQAHSELHIGHELAK